MENDRKNCTSLDQISDSNDKTDMKEALLLKRADLTRKLKELDVIISELQREYSLQLQQLQAQKKPMVDALHHITALLRFEGYYSIPDTRHDSAAFATAGASITDAASELLEELHQPMHYKDIAAQLVERNVYIPGKDAAATLLSRMCRDSRFKRTKKRGTYALSTWQVRSPKPTDTLIDDIGHMEELITNGSLRRQRIIAQSRNQYIGSVWDLMVSNRIRNSISLFATGMCYGRAS
jgi:hypothetical protein